MSEFLEEERWEHEIGGMLGRLPPVDPPPGFIQSALDHRPLYAGRVIVGLLALSLAALLAAVSTDAAGRTRITPQIDELAGRHAVAVRAGVLGSMSGEVDYRVDTPVDMPAGFQRTRNLEAEDIRQAVYARGDEAVSVFVQDGRVRWESLPADGRTAIDGLPAWVDANRQLTIVEGAHKVVTVVGLPPTEVEDVLRTLPRSGPSLVDRAHNTVNSITGQLGYPDLG